MVRFLLGIVLLFCSFSVVANEGKLVDKFSAKKSMLAKLRGDDFAHAGDIEAVEFVLQQLPILERKKNNNILNLGSGYGGTANFFYKNGFKKVWGVDQDKNAVEYSTLKYPHIKFFEHDYYNISAKFRKNFFSVIYMFNNLYSIENKDGLFKQLEKISGKGCYLVIFDYSSDKDNFNLVGSKTKPMRDFVGNVMYPLDQKTLINQLQKDGWLVRKKLDISEKYIDWYNNFLKVMSEKRKSLLSMYNEKDVEELENLLNKILFNLKEKKLGGLLIVAEKI